jgi:hypothetical protein
MNQIYRAAIQRPTITPNLDRLTLDAIRGIEGTFSDTGTVFHLWTTLKLSPFWLWRDTWTVPILQMARAFVNRRMAEPTAIPVTSKTPIDAKVFIRVEPLSIQTPGVLIAHDLTRLGYRIPGVREPICLIQMRKTTQWIPAELVYLQAPGIRLDPLTHDFFRQDQNLNGEN